MPPYNVPEPQPETQHDNPPVHIINHAAEPFTHGLTGVNIAMDNVSSNTLYGSIFLILSIVFLVRLAQRGTNFVRHITNLDSSSAAQEYWGTQTSLWPSKIKRGLLYAPLRNKRHNREIQLSRAINVGTIPSRLHTIVLIFYLLSNVGYCLILDYSKQENASFVAEIRGRTGHLAVVNMLPLFLLAGRNNPLIRLLRISFDTFNLMHRWIGRIVVIESIAHVVAWACNERTATGSTSEGWLAITHSDFLLYGLAGTIAMLLIFIQAPSAIRHAFYETFLHIHQFLALVALVTVFLHIRVANLPQIPLLIVICVLWTWDRCARWARLIHRNVSFSNGITKVSVEALPAEACRVTFHLARPWTFRPGAHVYVYLPAISFWMSHPFSIAWHDTKTSAPSSLLARSDSNDTLTEDIEKLPKLELPTSASSSASSSSTSVSLLIAARTGMTRALYNRARNSPNGVFQTRGALEGPYAGHESLLSYGTVVLFAGGVGITHQLGHIRHLLSARARTSTATRKILLVWSVRSFDQLEWVKPWMDEILAMPHRRDMLRIVVFVSQPKNTREMMPAAVPGIVSERVQLFPGRAKPRVVLEKECRERVGAMTVGICGPGALADEVRQGVRECLAEEGQLATLDFWEEAFTW